MYIESTIELEYNSGINGTKTGIVIGKIENFSWLNDFKMIGVNYSYEDQNGLVIGKGGFAIEGEDIESMNQQIDSMINQTEYSKREQQRAYLAFQQEMKITFDVSEDKLTIKE